MPEETPNPEPQHAHLECPLCAMLPLLERRWNEATKGHFRASRVEFLKGVRSLIDDRIEHLSKQETKGSRVVVE